MFLSMAGLTRTRNGGYRARKGIPKDVRAAYQNLFGSGWEAKLFLPAGMPLADAKAKFAEWLAEIETRIESIRAQQRGEGQGLTQRQARALAGEWYQWFVARYEEAPGDPEGWSRALQELTEEMQEQFPDSWESGYPEDWLREPHVREGVRPLIADRAETAQFLASKGVVLTSKARELFLDCVAENYAEVLLLFIRRAKGDYSPDNLPRQFPEFTRVPKKQATGLSPWALFEQWVKEAKPAVSTIDRWRGVFQALEAKFKNADAITENDAREWIRSLATSNRSAETVSGIWLGAARRVFKWAAEQKLIRENPFTSVKVTVPRRSQTREKAFTPEEAEKILGMALAIDPRKNTFKGAQRWVPWLCAYSGARAGEITQLRGIDIIPHGGFYAMKLTPDAGTIKTRKARIVPLHEHLLAQGFLEFVNERGKGALFYNSGDQRSTANDPLNPKRPRAVKTRERLAAWVRTLGVKDREISPNHSWRHTFKQIADRHGISERVSDAITGHAPATVSRSYGAPTIEDMERELMKFPRYKT